MDQHGIFVEQLTGTTTCITAGPTAATCLFLVVLKSKSDVGCLLQCSAARSGITGTEPVRAQVAISPPSYHAPASLTVLVDADTGHTGGRRGIWTAAVEFRLDSRQVRMPMAGVALECGDRARAQGLRARARGSRRMNYDTVAHVSVSFPTPLSGLLF
jgi:hypothetical protein